MVNFIPSTYFVFISLDVFKYIFHNFFDYIKCILFMLY